MPALAQLWAPILLSALLVFLGSSLVHMVLKWHNSEYKKLPGEDEIRAAIRKSAPPPGQYVIPHCVDPAEQRKEENKQKFVEGPVGMMIVMPNGPPQMGGPLAKWFAFNIVVAFFVAYVSSHALPIGTEYLRVFQIAGTVAFMAYGLGEVPSAIWFGKPWTATLKHLGDALLYGALTGGSFGWLWPHG
jgi:hypothetical protein